PGAASRIDLFLSDKRSRETVWLDLIHSGATCRSSSGRFMTNAAATRFSLSHQTLKLDEFASPRTTVSVAPAESPHSSYERSKTSEKKYGTCVKGCRSPRAICAQC